MREDLIEQAISFLSDNKVKESPLSKRISFLEGKGLTYEEINESIKRAYPDESSSTESTTSKTDQQPTKTKSQLIPRQPIPPARIIIPKRNNSKSWINILIWSIFAGGSSWFLASYIKVRSCLFAFNKKSLKNWFMGWPFFKSESEKIVQEILEIKKSVDGIKNEQHALKEQVVEQCHSLKELINSTRDKMETWYNSEEESHTKIQILTESINKINLLLPQVKIYILIFRYKILQMTG